MKKFILLASALFIIASSLFAQSGGGSKKHQIFVLPTRGAAFGEFVRINDFVYIIADSTMYCSKVAMGPVATGTYMLASASRYNVANMAVIAGVVTASSGTYSSTLDVTGTGTFLGALRAAGAVGFGTSYNKFTIAAATGNTAIAGTLAVTGASSFTGTMTIPGSNTIARTNANGVTFNNSVTVTDTVFGAVTQGTKILVGTAETISRKDANGVTFNNSVTVTDTAFSTTESVSGNSAIGGTLGVTGITTLTGALNANGAWKSTAYQQIDSTSGAVTAGKQIVGYWSKATGGTDTLSLANMAVGERITVIKLGSAGAGGGVNLVVKAPALLVIPTAVFYPNAGSTTGATSVSLTTAAPTKTFYKMDATHIWVY